MKVNWGGLSTDARGTLGGIVASRNRGGAYVRKKVSPIQPVSTFSSFARERFKTLSQAWATDLDDTERADWNAWAAIHPVVDVFGNAVILSGIAAYQQLNSRILQVGKPRIDSPPATFIATSILTAPVTSNQDSGVPETFTFAFTASGALDASETTYVFVTPPIAPGRLPQKNDFRLLNAPGDHNLTLTSAAVTKLVARYPLISWPLGKVSYLRAAVLNWSTGCVSVGVVKQVTWPDAP